jgi:long-chain acyl-CoA synthetase
VATMSTALDRCARLHARNRAIVEASRTWTWAEHLDRVARAAGVLSAMGLAPGDRFAILSRNTPRHCELLHAGYWSGIVPVPINVRLAPPEIAAILTDASVKAIAFDEPFVALAAHEAIRPFAANAFVIGDAAVGALPAYESLVASAARAPLHDSREDDDAILLYTGGTTGRAKGVRLTHRNLVANGFQCMPTMRFTERDVYLHIAPMFHSADLIGTGPTLVGAAHAYLPQFTPPALLQTLQSTGATLSMMAPTMIIVMLQQARPADYDLSALRMLLYGSAPMATEWIARAIEALPGVELVQGYGLTETAPILTFLPYAEHERALASGDTTRLKSCGRPLPAVDLRIVDARGAEVPCGEAGEVIVRAPNVTRGYLNQPEVNAASFRDGWFHTGDVGRVDDDGYVYLLDRKKDMIVTGGENVYSSEVEQAIYQHADVSECAVIGVPHPTYGEALVAVIVPVAGRALDEDAMIAHCRARIGGYKIPRQWRFVRELPKSAMGKILKTELRREFGVRPLFHDVPRHDGDST